jgi:hypothetical protein
MKSRKKGRSESMNMNKTAAKADRWTEIRELVRQQKADRNEAWQRTVRRPLTFRTRQRNRK